MGELGRVSAPDIEEAIKRLLHECSAVGTGVMETLTNKIEKIVVRKGGLEIHWLSEFEQENAHRKAAQIRLLAWGPKDRRVEQDVAYSQGPESTRRAHSNSALLSAIAKSRQWIDQLTKGTPISEIARGTGIGEKQTRTLLNLAFLSPTYVRSLISGALEGPTITALAPEVPLEWLSA